MLPDRARTIMQVRLAAVLGQAGDSGAEAQVLRQTGDRLYRPGAPLRELAQRLVEVGAVDAARKLAADTGDINERQQVLSGMIDGALKSGNLNVGSEVLRIAHRLPHQGSFDPFAFQAKTLVVALAKAGRYRQALAAFPTSPMFGPDLPNIAKQACAADPTLADATGSVMASAALRQAAAKFGAVPPVEEVRAYAMCKGDAAAKRLIDAMPVDVADKVAFASKTASPSGDPDRLAAEAFRASEDADQEKADRLFAEAKAKLDADLGSRDASRETRQGFDTSTSQVAVWMTRANRPEGALGLVARLPALERLPILFTLAQTAVRGVVDPTIFITAIGSDFAAEPALIDIEANEIRALRGDLPLGSPVYAQIEPWLDKLPPVAATTLANRLPPNKGADQLKAILAAFEVAAPSVAVVQRALDEAGHGAVAQAIAEAKALKLTPREIGTVELIRNFIAGLPNEVLTPAAAIELDGLEPKRSITATPVDSLLVALERVTLNAGNVTGAHDVFASVDPGSPLKAYAATILAVGEARLGRPREALAALATIEHPSARFAILRAVVQVRPSPSPAIERR